MLVDQSCVGSFWFPLMKRKPPSGALYCQEPYTGRSLRQYHDRFSASRLCTQTVWYYCICLFLSLLFFIIESVNSLELYTDVWHLLEDCSGKESGRTTPGISTAVSSKGSSWTNSSGTVRRNLLVYGKENPVIRQTDRDTIFPLVREIEQ